MQRFTPRKDNSNWSELNKARLKKLIAERRMTEVGLSKISDEVLAQRARAGAIRAKSEGDVPEYFKEALRGDRWAWENFNKLAPTYRRQYIQWVTSAKREETRRKRIEEAKGLLTKNQKLGMK